MIIDNIIHENQCFVCGEELYDGEDVYSHKELVAKSNFEDIYKKHSAHLSCGNPWVSPTKETDSNLEAITKGEEQ